MVIFFLAVTQLDVAQEIRKRLGLETGDCVEFVAEEGRTVIVHPGRKPTASKSTSEFWACSPVVKKG